MPDQRYQPPGPQGVIKTTFAFQRSPLSVLSEVIEKYGDISFLNLLRAPVIVLNHPDYVQHILKDNHHNYDRHGPVFTMARNMFGNGLVTAARPGWLVQRRLLQPAFHRDRMTELSTLMTEAIEEMLERWEHKHETKTTVDVRAEMQQLTLQILIRALFGTEPQNTTIHRYMAAMATSTRELTAYMRFPLLPLNVPTRGHRRFHNALRVLDEITFDIIHKNRDSTDNRGTLLSSMMSARDHDTGEGMHDKQLRDEVFTLLFAGHETTASTLTWAWYLIVRDPSVEGRLREEVDRVLGDRPPTISDLPNLTYTRRVVEETLRLYPPGWQQYRQAAEDDEIDGYRIPAGTTVFWSAYFVHRHRRFWDEPDRFDPDRFADEDCKRRDRPGYLPFGAGPRLCIGNNFAMVEIQLVIAMIMQRYRLYPTSNSVIEPLALITLEPARALTVRLERR
ncbi:cytochrome P450 [Nocardia sp. NPDC004573]